MGDGVKWEERLFLRTTALENVAKLLANSGTVTCLRCLLGGDQNKTKQKKG